MAGICAASSSTAKRVHAIFTLLEHRPLFLARELASPGPPCSRSSGSPVVKVDVYFAPLIGQESLDKGLTVIYVRRSPGIAGMLVKGNRASYRPILIALITPPHATSAESFGSQAHFGIGGGGGGGGGGGTFCFVLCFCLCVCVRVHVCDTFEFLCCGFPGVFFPPHLHSLGACLLVDFFF